MSDDGRWAEIVPMQMSFPVPLFDRIELEAQRRGISFPAEVRRMLTFAYDFEDAVNAHGRAAHPAYHDRLPAEPPVKSDENGAPL